MLLTDAMEDENGRLLAALRVQDVGIPWLHLSW